MHERLGVQTGKPLADTRRFVEACAGAPRVGELPPLVLAALREPMVALAGEIADGVVFANAARSHMHALARGRCPRTDRANPTFFIGNMIPTCITTTSPPRPRVNRRTLARLRRAAELPRTTGRRPATSRRWTPIERALATGERDRIPQILVRSLARGHDALRTAGGDARRRAALARRGRAHADPRAHRRRHGNQMKAFEELFAAFE